MFTSTAQALAASVALKNAGLQRKAFERERHTYYITGGRPRPRSEPREIHSPPAYRPRPSEECGVGVGTLLIGGLLFGGLF